MLGAESCAKRRVQGSLTVWSNWQTVVDDPRFKPSYDLETFCIQLRTSPDSSGNPIFALSELSEAIVGQFLTYAM